ncbi:MAG: YihY/virulence factor BrkB family protein [Bdellovibrionales bacterium]
MKPKIFVTRFIEKFIADDTTTLAASLAFYTALSLAPLLILFVSVSARLGTDLQQGLISQVNDLAGRDAAKSVAAVIHGANAEPQLTSIAGFMGVATLLFSASLIFGQLRSTLNRILDVPAHSDKTESFFNVVHGYLRGKLIHILIAVAFILVMIASVLISTILSAGLVAHHGTVTHLVNALLSAFFYVVVFSLIFHFIPDQRLQWSRAIQGGALTSILFVIGKELIGIYLGSAALGSAYGAAGSIVVFLVWVYYSALITFVGAQVSSLLGKNAPARMRGH